MQRSPSAERGRQQMRQLALRVPAIADTLAEIDDMNMMASRRRLNDTNDPVEKDRRVWLEALSQPLIASASAPDLHSSSSLARLKARTGSEWITFKDLKREDIPEVDASGLKWRKVGDAKPAKGKELANTALSAALQQKTSFSTTEWDAFKIKSLRPDHYIRAGASYFQPAEVDEAVSTTTFDEPSPPRRPPPRLRAIEPSLPPLPVKAALDDGEDDEPEENDERVVALGNFNHRYTSRSTNARGLLTALEVPHNQQWNTLGRRYHGAVGEVFRNRFFKAETYDPFSVPKVAPPPPRRRHRRWRLDDSIWYQRKVEAWCNDYYENEASMRSVFDTDWELAKLCVAKFITRNDRSGKAWLDEDGNGVHDAVDRASHTLFESAHALYGAFDYYSALLDSGKNKAGEVEIFMISYNAFSEFLRDCGLVSAQHPLKAYDLIWTASNSVPHDAFEQLKLLDRWNHPKMMSRHEFLEATVRMSIELYGPKAIGGEISVAAAVGRFCKLLHAALPPEALQESNDFRKRDCYNELVDAALRRQKSSLQAVFDVYARSNRDSTDELQDKHLMSIGEWLAFLEHMGLLATGQVTYFGAKMIFKWSMIRSRPDHSAKSERKMRNLTFCDFLEGLVRIACIAALPTDAEIEAADALDAGEYVLALEEAGELDAFVAERKVGWQSRPRQHVSRCVAHLLSIIVRTVKMATLRPHDNAEEVLSTGITEKDAETFEAKRRLGRSLSHVQSKAGLLDGVRAAASIVRTRQLDALRSARSFQKLTETQLDTLCESMSQASFDHGQYVFNQGDLGDAFYIITEGDASVLRTEPGQDDEKELGKLSTGAHFGERALIKQEVRYASVRAESKRLFAVFITREGFEKAIGATLESLVPDEYRLDAHELLQRLSKVPIFSETPLRGRLVAFELPIGQTLSDKELKMAADACVEVRFTKGQDVVVQGEEGDTMYVITRGTAQVLRQAFVDDKPAGTLKMLSMLGEWQTFGERALLENEKRYATVRVSSDELVVMSLAREIFLTALGRKLVRVGNETVELRIARPRASLAGSPGGSASESPSRT